MPKTGQPTDFFIVEIKKFLTSPIAVTLKGGPSTFLTPWKEGEPFRHEWSCPVDTYFTPQFEQQRTVLSEVRAFWRADLNLQRFTQAPVPTLQGLCLHPKILEVVTNWFASGHFDDTVMYGFIAVNEAVREKSGSGADDGGALMQHAFFPKIPLLRLSPKVAEQRAHMELFAAA
jgi:hypothetical protein